MTDLERILARNSIHRHLVERLVPRKVAVDYTVLHALEQRLEAMTPTFVQPGQTRYRLNVHLSEAQRYRVVYDTQYQCLLTIWARRPRARRAA